MSKKTCHCSVISLSLCWVPDKTPSQSCHAALIQLPLDSQMRSWFTLSCWQLCGNCHRPHRHTVVYKAITVVRKLSNDHVKNTYHLTLEGVWYDSCMTALWLMGSCQELVKVTGRGDKLLLQVFKIHYIVCRSVYENKHKCSYTGFENRMLASIFQFPNLILSFIHLQMLEDKSSQFLCTRPHPMSVNWV